MQLMLIQPPWRQEAAFGGEVVQVWQLRCQPNYNVSAAVWASLVDSTRGKVDFADMGYVNVD